MIPLKLGPGPGRAGRLAAALLLPLALTAGAGAAGAGAAGASTTRPGAPGTGTADPAATATVSAAPAQTMAGFGASGNWWVTPVHYFPASAQQHIAGLLFGKDGIQLSRYRYNIGGGGVGADVPTGGESELGAYDRAPQTPYVAPGIYDWSHDPGGTAFLKYAAQYHVPQIEANANGAPPAFTTNSQSCGGQLAPGKEQAYADYLATVVRHAHDAWGATISYVSPMNEPDYTRGECTQEGTQVPVSQRAAVVTALGRDLAAQAPYAQVIADESSRVSDQFNTEVPQWLSVPGTARYVAALAHHTYDFPSDAALQQARAVGEQAGKPLWATEICCMDYQQGGMPAWGEQYDPAITGGLSMAQFIYQDLTQANDAAFDWWVALSAAIGCDPAHQPGCPTAVNSVGWNDGLLYFDPNFAVDHDYQVYPTKRFYTLGQFSRFVRPGAQRHDVTGAPAGLDVLAFRAGSQWQLVVINLDAAGSAPASFDLQLPGSGTLRAAGTYQTSASHDLAKVADPAVAGTTATLTTPAQSVTTFLLGQGS